MPVTNAKQIKKITSLCSCTIPKKFLKILEKYEDNPSALKEAGLAYAIEQVVDLVASDINGIHLYTMNRPETAKKNNRCNRNYKKIKQIFNFIYFCACQPLVFRELHKGSLNNNGRRSTVF